jgi:hypothetical protein
MGVIGVADVRPIMDRVCARPDVLEAYRNRDLRYVIKVLRDNGLRQGKTGDLTGQPQGRISEWVPGIRAPRHVSVTDDIATWPGFPAAARGAHPVSPLNLHRPLSHHAGCLREFSQHPDHACDGTSSAGLNKAAPDSRLWRIARRPPPATPRGRENGG